MPRPLRIHIPGGIYHVTLRGNHRQPIFSHDGERALLNKIVARALEKFGARVHAYCWMTNHLHLVVQVGAAPLGRLMQQIASEYARAFQQNIATTGHLFENRHHATLIDTDTYLLEAVRYVHRNPVDAGMVARAGQYRWSSHAAYVGGGEPWVTIDFALGMFSPHRTRAVALYRAFVDQTPPAGMAAELTSLEKGTPMLGNFEMTKSRPDSLSGVSPKQFLDDVAKDSCAHFGVTLEELRSSARFARLVTARTWVTQTALQFGTATLAEIARYLNRDESTLRQALRRKAGSDAGKVSPVSPL